MVVLVDSREKNSHILGYFDKQGMATLECGDYPFMIPAADVYKRGGC